MTIMDGRKSVILHDADKYAIYKVGPTPEGHVASEYWEVLYIREEDLAGADWAWSVRLETWEYFRIVECRDGEVLGYLGRFNEKAPFFNDIEENRSLTYFIDYRAGKRLYFTFDGVGLFRVEMILPGGPLLLVLKKIDPKNMEEKKDDRAAYHINVTGHQNIVTAGQGNVVEVGKMQWKGNIGKLRENLESIKVPAEDIAEIVAIAEEARPDTADRFPEKAESWLAKMYKKAKEGLWEVSLHTAGHLLAGYIHGFYGGGGAA